MNKVDKGPDREWGYICRICRREFDYGQAVITHVETHQESTT